MFSHDNIIDHSNNLNTTQHNLTRVSSSSSSNTSSNNHSPLTTTTTTTTTRTMEEVWKDISLSATTTSHRTNSGEGYRGFILQDFLAKPFSNNNDTPTSVSSPGYGSPSSPPPPPPQPPMMFNLNSGPDQMNFLADDHRSRNVCPFDQVLTSANSSSGLMGNNIGGMMMLPAKDRSGTGGDRRHKRMIKNRESAARSRARKQVG